MTRQNRRPTGLAPMRSAPFLPYHGRSGNNAEIGRASAGSALAAPARIGKPANEARGVAREGARKPSRQEARDPPREPRQRRDHDQRPVGADGADRDRRNLLGAGGKPGRY